MKTLLIVFLLISSLSFGQIPNDIKLTEEIISITTNFDSDTNIKIKGELISFTPEFTLYQNGNKIGKSVQRIISIGTINDIYDEKNNKIGSVEEQLFMSLGFYSRYKVYDKNDKLVAISEKHKYLTTVFNITDVNNNNVCTIKRPAINLMSDTWYVHFNNVKFDKRLLIFIPCYKTYYDNKSED